jgi:hypothetical protein
MRGLYLSLLPSDRPDGGVYLSDGVVLYPDGSTNEPPPSRDAARNLTRSIYISRLKLCKHCADILCDGNFACQ